MLELNGPDMTGGHFVRTVEKAGKRVDRAVTVRADLAARSVTADTVAAAATISDVIDEAGSANSPG